MHLGSSALVDDYDDPMVYPGRQPILSSSLPRSAGSFSMGGFAHEPMFRQHQSPWGPPATPMPAMNVFAPPPPPGFGIAPWGISGSGISAFSGQGSDRPEAPAIIRKLLRRACEDLTDLSQRRSLTMADGGVASGPSPDYIPLEDVKFQVERLNHGNQVKETDLINLCETEGNESNGGGVFDVHVNPLSGRKFIRFLSGDGRARSQPLHRAVGAPGEIGSPTIGTGTGPGHFGGRYKKNKMT